MDSNTTVNSEKLASSNVRHSSRLASLTTSHKRLSFDTVTPVRRRKSEVSTPIAVARKRLCREKFSLLQQLCLDHEKNVAEEFFLGQRNLILDFSAWRKSPPLTYLTHLKNNEFKIDDLQKEFGSVDDSLCTPAVELPSTSSLDKSPSISRSNEDFVRRNAKEAVVDVGSSFPTPLKVKEQQCRPFTMSAQNASNHVVENGEASVSSPSTSFAPSAEFIELSYSRNTVLFTQTSFTPANRFHAWSSVSPRRALYTDPRQLYLDGNIERVAKQEANILRRIAELRRDGLWSASKLPKCLDPPRSKTHWDYVLEEMQWMAMDFEQERKWKRNAARKLTIAVVRHKRELDDRERKIELDKEKELKRIASFLAREIRQFWNNVEKVVEYKTENIIEAKKKRALDKHLDFIVDQTEKYSNLISEGLNRIPPPAGNEDSEYEDDETSSDDESTIARAEKDIDQRQVSEEVSLLQKESTMDVDDLLSSLPPGYLENYGGSSDTRSTSGADSSEFSESKSVASEQGDAHSLSEMDDEKLSEELIREAERPGDTINFEKLQSCNSEERQEELTHIAEAAEKFLPKGFTLDSANVVTKQPFLLKHELREYQQVGLDWLVTLYDKKLNGILADEMGLGKTIQTIALLAHLACEKSNWGPHLIVVPTTVLLNWEMECKKWCPAFKILTYYGSIKERKEKRKGWSKQNSFHICITSYKLVLQDLRIFRRKHWQYLILDEAQNIKNFKSMRWQMLLNFRTERRLLLTGTPLQNSLMELWSLMHFLMPHIFGSHKDFRDWFSNPLTGMIEGTQEYNEQTVKRLHKVLRPFLLRRLKSEVEKQLPKKFEHVVMCQLSKRQRFLYEDFMSRSSTKNQLSSGNVMSVMNILMQLRKVCNHPFLFEPRPIISPYIVQPIEYKTAACVLNLLDFDDLKNVKIPNLTSSESVDKFSCQRTYELSRIENLTKKVLEEQPAVPRVGNFRFSPRVITSSCQNSIRPTAPSKRLQFIIPTHVAESMDLRQPFFLQMGTPSGVKFIPVKLDDQPSDLSERIACRQDSSTCDSFSGTIPGQSMTLANNRQPPTVLKLIPQLSQAQVRHRVTTFQAVPAVNNSKANLSSGVPQFFSQLWSDTRQPEVANKTAVYKSKYPRMAIITARTHLTSKITDKANYRTTTTSFVPLIAGTAHKVTVHDIVPRTTSICVFDPKKAQEKIDHSALVSPATSLNPFDTPGTSNDTFFGLAKPSTSNAHRVNFELVSLKRKKIERVVTTFIRTVTENQRRCKERRPVYGENLLRLCTINKTVKLGECLATLETHFDMIKPILDRFIINVPPVKTTSSISLKVSRLLEEARLRDEESLSTLKHRLHSLLTVIDPIALSQLIQFPELRLIEYDCGKLQSLSMLLRRLKVDGHRCLIFTQMARMLDILESFLSYHGHTYLRLDGATRIEHRQILMERFNHDKRIFCFILSTRSGGIGVNLTGADTVIFYDSDWNPTMDAQAQDRCHRIGQTRDVHIYRLISEKTVEENILKKSMQKRKLGEIAIEEGAFTCEFFKKSNIIDIFELVNADATKLPSLSQHELEQVMTKVEDDERDIVAAKIAGAEAIADLAEFDEDNQQTSTASTEEVDPDVLKVEQEMKHLMEQLKPVERYAVRYIETLVEPDRFDEVRQTEEEIEHHKRKWEQAQEMSLLESDNKRRRIRDAEFDLTYQYEDSASQVNNSSGSNSSQLLTSRKRRVTPVHTCTQQMSRVNGSTAESPSNCLPILEKLAPSSELTPKILNNLSYHPPDSRENTDKLCDNDEDEIDVIDQKTPVRKKFIPNGHDSNIFDCIAESAQERITCRVVLEGSPNVIVIDDDDDSEEDFKLSLIKPNGDTSSPDT